MNKKLNQTVRRCITAYTAKPLAGFSPQTVFSFQQIVGAFYADVAVIASVAQSTGFHLSWVFVS
jgi:hypothetical protein